MSTAHEQQSTKRRGDPFRGGALHRLSGWRLWLSRFPVVGLRWYLGSLRLEMPAMDRARLAACPRPALIIMSHNRSLLAPVIIDTFLRTAKVTCLISPSRAAAWEVEFYEDWGFDIVRGSSSRRGLASTRELLRAFRRGQDLGMTPDGPIGPLYAFKRSILGLARMTSAPILLISANAEVAWRAPSWDRHVVPLPFSTVQVRCDWLQPFTDHTQNAESAVLEKLRNAYLALCRENDTLPYHDA